MSFWKSLFGGARPSTPSGHAAAVRTLEHEGYLIEATPMQDGGQFLVAGTISKMIGGELKSHKFIRADRLATLEDAAAMSIRKGQQIIDQTGERMFKLP